MKKKYQNAFLIFGLVVLAIMVSQLDFKEVGDGIQRAGYWFLAVVLLWAVLYIFNTGAWWIIIKSGERKDYDNGGQKLRVSDIPEQKDNELPKQQEWHTSKPFSFLWLYKITVSGFALNYATPGGLMGGEPYRIMSLSPFIGTERATSSVLLYVMTHIFSHFWFWLLSCILYVLTQPMNVVMGLLLAGIAAFCLFAIWFFLKGYKRGIAVSGMRILSHIPFVKKWARRFFDNHAEQLHTIDQQIAALHGQNPRTFFAAVFLELACRVASALEIFFILLVIMPSANYLQCILILAFTSLFANMLFFIPLQLGGREGGFLLSAKGLSIGAREGIFVALLVRIREIIWTAIGLLLIKLENKKG
ncbi:MAG: flippase-like domain-containing protein [Prevotella sp.]|nr:flippase-like domain-containing protein [Prevotella sp.]